MGLKCSVLGHKYGDTTVERDREEQGSEVVITIQETETCKRCGAERVVSENKEVTSIATPDDPVPAGDASDAGEPTVGDADGSDRDGADEDPADGATDESDGEADDVGPDVADDDESAVEDAPEPDAPEPDEGAEILDAESEEPVDDELADPTVDPTDDAADDEPVEEDAVIMGADDADDDPRDGRAPGEWPEEPASEGEEWSPTDVVDDQHTITAPDAGTEENGAVTVPDGEFACPECGYTTPVEASSLRAGDFCPDCRKGALVHRAEGTHEEE